MNIEIARETAAGEIFRKGNFEHCKKKSKQGTVRAIIGHEIVSANSTLKKVGKKAKYDGGFRFARGSISYRDMSHVIADMAGKIGIDLRRPGAKKTAQFILGLPDEEYLGFSYTAFKHDKRLPSIAMVDANQTAANLQYYYETKVLGVSQFAALTFPALECRTTAGQLKEAVDLAFKRYNVLKRKFSSSGLGEFLYAQLEMPFDEKKQNFYLHFHVFLKLPRGDFSQPNALRFFKSKISWMTAYSGLKLKSIARKDVDRCIRYGTKPCLSTYQVAKTQNAEILATFLDKMKKRRMSRVEGSLKATLKGLEEKGRRVSFHQCEVSSKREVRLVEIRKRDHFDKRKQRNRPADLPQSHTPSECSQGAKENVYCGCGQPVVSPAGRNVAFGVVQNFNEGSFQKSLKLRGSNSFYSANSNARNNWVKETGKDFDLEEFLRPIASHVMQAMKNQEVQNYTVIASPGVVRTLSDLTYEESEKPIPMINVVKEGNKNSVTVKFPSRREGFCMSTLIPDVQNLTGGLWKIFIDGVQKSLLPLVLPLKNLVRRLL